MKDLEKINDFEAGKFYVWKEKFAICKVKDIKNLPENLFAVIKDKNEITLIVEESKIPSTALKVEKGFKLITFDMVLPFGLIGFIAKISSALAENGISIFVISSYSTDHVFVKEKDLEKTVKVLGSLGFERQPG